VFTYRRFFLLKSFVACSRGGRGWFARSKLVSDHRWVGCIHRGASSPCWGQREWGRPDRRRECGSTKERSWNLLRANVRVGMGFGYGHDAVSELAIFMPLSSQSGGFYTDASSMRFLYVSCFKDIIRKVEKSAKKVTIRCKRRKRA
jgi:hypothetical protein